MRYLFRGLKKDTGRAVWGYVTAEVEEHAYNALAEEGVAVESLQPVPDAAAPEGDVDPFGEPVGEPSAIAGEIDSALDAGSKQVDFDALTQRYRGKRVWVLDRFKMKRRVMEVVDAAIAQAHSKSEDEGETRHRISEALEKLFGDQRNISSEASAASMALEQQISRMTRVVAQMERAASSIALNAGRGGGGGGGYTRTLKRRGLNDEQDKVLLEIFQSNVELRRKIDGGPGGESAEAPDAAEAPPTPEATRTS